MQINQQTATKTKNDQLQQQDSIKMLQIAISVLLLACLHLSAGAAVGTMPRIPAPVEGEGEALWCNHDIVANQDNTIRKARREAEITSRVTHSLLYGEHDPQLKIDGLKESGQCQSIVLPPTPYSVFNSTLQSTANALWKLTHLLQMYHKVWRAMELHEGYSEESESAKLDFLDIVYSRFTNQVEQYLQVHRCSCKDTNCTVHQGSNDESIQEVIQREFNPSGCSRKLFLGKIIKRMQREAISTYLTLSHHDLPAEFTPWPVCATIQANPIRC